MFLFSSRRRHTRCALVTGVQTCALPIFAMRGGGFKPHMLRATEDPITRKVTDVVPVALPKIKLKDENDWSTVSAAMESVAQEQGGTAWMVESGRASCRERVCQYV